MDDINIGSDTVEKKGNQTASEKDSFRGKVTTWKTVGPTILKKP